MTGVNDIPAGLRTPTQIPLDAKGYFVSQDIARNLGAANNLAYTYEKGLQIYCAREETRWEWREPNFPGEVGLRATLFTYPNSFIVNGIDYSNKSYNFYPANPYSTRDIQEVINNLDLSFYWKKGKSIGARTPTDLPVGVTNNEYTRTGYISATLPTKPAEAEGLIRNSSDVLYQFHIHNLAIELKKFENIRNFQPTLIISRFLPSKRKRVSRVEETTHRHKRAGFKVPLSDDGVRLQRIPINKGYQVIDFGQEHFFSFPYNFTGVDPSNIVSQSGYLMTRGVGKKYSNVRFFNPDILAGNRNSSHCKHKSFVYLEFQIQITFNSVTYISKPLGKLKMEASFFVTEEVSFIPGQIVDISTLSWIPMIRFKQV